MTDDLDEERRQLHAADPASRHAALRGLVQSLCSFAVNARDEARAVLLRTLDDPDAAVRCLAVNLLYWVGPAEVLMPAIQAADRPTRRTAFQVLQREDLACSSVLRAAVLAGLRDPEPAVARRAFELGGAAQFLDDAARRPQVVAMLTHASQRVRADALRACADQRLEVEHAEVLRAVRHALRRPATRLVALRVLQTVEPRAVSRGLVDDVAPCLAAEDRATRYRAARTIASFGHRARHALPALAAAYQRHVAANPIERGYRNSGSEYHSYRLAYAALRLGGAAAWSVEAPWVVEALVRHVSCDPLDTEGLAALEWLGPSAAAAEPAVAARAAELLDQLWDRADRVAPIATLISIAPGGARTHELRERVLARAPELAATLDARLVAFAPHADRATRMLAWLAATPPLVHLFLTDLAELALDEIEAAPATATLAALPSLPRIRGFERIHPRLERIAVRGALRR